MSSEIIKLSKISKQYVGADKNVVVLKNVNLKINKGELVSLTGASGSGKSTLLHIIALLDQPTSGEVFFKKKNFSKSNDNEKDLVRRKGISIIYQQNNLLSDFTALENVVIPLVNNGYSWEESVMKARKTLSLADEPTGSLDRKTANEIFSLFLKLKSKKRAILYATHNRDLSNKADYKLNILDGNVIKRNEWSC